MIRIGESSLYESIRLRLQPAWIPSSWQTHYDLTRSIYFRRPSPWYPTSIFGGQDVCYKATEHSTDLIFELRSVDRRQRGTTVAEHIASFREIYCASEGEYEGENCCLEKDIRLAKAGDAIWPRFESERPQFKLAGMIRPGRGRLMQCCSSEGERKTFRDIYVLTLDNHIVSASFWYPGEKKKELSHLLKRMVGTIRFSPEGHVL